jgi:hypothetical protein
MATKTFQLPQWTFPLLPTLLFLPFSLPLLIATKTLSITILCDPFIKKRVIMGTHWELQCNMLGTNGKMENNLSLLGVKFEVIL